MPIHQDRCTIKPFSKHAASNTDIHKFETYQVDTLPRVLIPNEVLLHIFEYLPYNTLFRVSSVCKVWQAVSSDQQLWKQLCVCESIPIESSGAVLIQDLSLTIPLKKEDWKTKFVEHIKRQRREVSLGQLLWGFPRTSPLQDMINLTSSAPVNIPQHTHIPDLSSRCEQCNRDSLWTLPTPSSYSSLAQSLSVLCNAIISDHQKISPIFVAKNLPKITVKDLYTNANQSYIRITPTTHASPEHRDSASYLTSPSSGTKESFLLHTLQAGCDWAPYSNGNLQTSASSNEDRLLDDMLLNSVMKPKFELHGSKNAHTTSPFYQSSNSIQQGSVQFPSVNKEHDDENQHTSRKVYAIPSGSQTVNSTDQSGSSFNSILSGYYFQPQKLNRHASHQLQSNICIPTKFILPLQKDSEDENYVSSSNGSLLCLDPLQLFHFQFDSL
ncbi:hypothetical protein MT418_006595 [Batrachochytrium dendrobatidis]